jgi:hypothetical protein
VPSHKMEREIKELTRICKRADDRETILRSTRNDLKNPEHKRMRDRMNLMRKNAAKAAKKRQTVEKVAAKQQLTAVMTTATATAEATTAKTAAAAAAEAPPPPPAIAPGADGSKTV